MLAAAEGGGLCRDQAGVQTDHAAFQRIDHPGRSTEIRGKDVGSQTRSRVVGQRNRLFFRVETNKPGDWPERLLAAKKRRRVHIDQNRGHEEGGVFASPFAAAQNAGAAVHRVADVGFDLGDRTVGAKVNGRVVPLRTILENGDQVEILASEAQHPQPSWLRFVVTGKARAGVRRFVRHKERDETVELGRKIYDEIVERLPAVLDKDAVKQALKRLKIESEDELMIAIARKRIGDEQVMEALMPGSAGGDVAPRPVPQRTAISIKGLTPGVAYHLAQCCHPIPGDRIVGLRREDEEIEVHVIGCDTLASGVDADWLDLAWGEGSDGGAARLCVILRDVPGALGTMASILGGKHANIVNLALVHRDGSFQTFHLDVEVHDLAHLHAIIAALREADQISSVERL